MKNLFIYKSLKKETKSQSNFKCYFGIFVFQGLLCLLVEESKAYKKVENEKEMLLI